MSRILTTTMTALALVMMAQGVHAQSMTAKPHEMEKPVDVKSISNEAELRMALSVPGTMSLKGSKIAQGKATNAKVKEFANFENAEQTAIAMVLKELQTPPAELPPKDMADLKKLEDAPKGLEFDRAYAKAQVEGHEKLLAITEAYLKNADLTATQPKEMEARHLAYLMKAVITQHIANAKELSAMLK